MTDKELLQQAQHIAGSNEWRIYRGEGACGGYDIYKLQALIYAGLKEAYEGGRKEAIGHDDRCVTNGAASSVAATPCPASPEKEPSPPSEVTFTVGPSDFKHAYVDGIGHLEHIDGKWYDDSGRVVCLSFDL